MFVVSLFFPSCPPMVIAPPLFSTPLTIENGVRVEISGPHETVEKNHLIKSINSEGFTAVVYSLLNVTEPA